MPSSADATSPHLGTVAERYALKRRIAAGGMGEVYEAHDTCLKRRVAIKFPRADQERDHRFLARLEKEALAIAALECQHCVTILDLHLGQERPFIVMEYLKGENLRQLLNSEGCLPVRRAARIVQQAAVGLQAAHAIGIIHRDLKPENLMVNQLPYVGDWVKVLDFGIARVAESPLGTTTTGTVMGTPHYMAPEQARGEPDLDGRADVYALSAILFELLTGVRAHGGSSYNEVVYRVLTENVPSLLQLRADLPHGLCRVVETGMAKDRRQRFATSDALAAALEPFARGVPEEQVLTQDQTRASSVADRGKPERAASRYLPWSFVALATVFGGWTALSTQSEAVGAAAEIAPGQDSLTSASKHRSSSKLQPQRSAADVLPRPAALDTQPMKTLGVAAPPSPAAELSRSKSASVRSTTAPSTRGGATHTVDVAAPSTERGGRERVGKTPAGFDPNPYD